MCTAIATVLIALGIGCSLVRSSSDSAAVAIVGITVAITANGVNASADV